MQGTTDNTCRIYMYPLTCFYNFSKFQIVLGPSCFTLSTPHFSLRECAKFETITHTIRHITSIFGESLLVFLISFSLCNLLWYDLQQTELGFAGQKNELRSNLNLNIRQLSLILEDARPITS